LGRGQHSQRHPRSKQRAIQHGLHDRDRRYYLVIAMCKTQARTQQVDCDTCGNASRPFGYHGSIGGPDSCRQPAWTPLRKATDSSASTCYVICLINLIFHPSSPRVCSYPHEWFIAFISQHHNASHNWSTLEFEELYQETLRK
jgi:hypothetical protein